jgi:hypothetical protein
LRITLVDPFTRHDVIAFRFLALPYGRLIRDDLGQLVRLVFQKVVPRLGNDRQTGRVAENLPLFEPLLVELGRPVHLPDDAQDWRA